MGFAASVGREASSSVDSDSTLKSLVHKKFSWMAWARRSSYQ